MVSMTGRSGSIARGVLFATLLLGVTVPRAAPAFCGFYVSGADAKLFNNATQVVLMRDGTRTVLSMQNNYEGPPESFAMVVPVPVVLQKENVKTLPRELFGKLDQLDAPRLVEYWEQDPCEELARTSEAKGGGPPRPAPAPAKAAARSENLGVTVEAEFTVGEYEVVILSAKDAAGLDTWLKQEKYKIPDGSEPYFRPYVQSGSKFFVARVDVSKVTFTKTDKGSSAMLSPLRFHYDSDTFTLPVRLGLVNSNGTQDLIVHILAKNQRFEVANYPNATIPTNFDVAENARDKFGSFYASLFDRTLEKNPKAVITEYSWDASTCDPCPGPALYGNDLATLGADALPSVQGQVTAPPSPAPPSPPSPPSPPGAPRRPPVMRGPRMSFAPSGFVITRLHARYSKESLGEDLVFRAAPAIAGGREVRTPPKTPPSPGDPKLEPTLEHGATPSSVNNFQGRYAIRHPWGGPITCKEPRRGIWGGPPRGHVAQTPGSPPSHGPTSAKDLAFVPRDVKLASFVRSAIPELGVQAEGAPVSPNLPAGQAAVGAAAAGTTAHGAITDGGADAGAESNTATKRGCLGCAGAPATPGSTGLGSLVALLALAVRRLARYRPPRDGRPPVPDPERLHRRRRPVLGESPLRLRER